jgi:hypothetical protein
LRCFKKQRRFAPTFVRHHSDSCSASSGITVRHHRNTHFWSLLSILWFLAIAFTASIRREKIEGVPSVIAAFCLVIVLFIIGIMYMGPAILLLLLIPCITATSKAFFLSKEKESRQRLTKDIKIIGACGIIAMVGLGAYSVYLRSSRTESDYILKWENTYSGKQALKNLKMLGAEAVNDFRAIVQRGGSTAVVIAAEGLAEVGDPESDVPLLLNALTSIRSIGSSTKSAKVEKALRTLSGIELPEGTATNIWRKEWQKTLQKSNLETEK